MQRPISIPTAVLLVLVTCAGAALLGYLLLHDPGDRQTGFEQVISKAAVPPRLPPYEPGTAWTHLPKPPPPEEPTEPDVTAGTSVVLDTSGSSSDSGGSRRHYGFSIGR